MAKKEAKAGAASTTPTEDKSKDKLTAKNASKQLDKTRGKAPTAREAEKAAMKAKNEPEEIPPLEEIARRATVAEQRTASPTQANPSAEYDETFKVTKEESAAIKRFLAKFRTDAKAEAGIVEPKAFLVNETGSDRVRWGGVTYSVPEGRNELTDAFVEEHFPDGVTADDLKKGLLGGRIKVEYEDVSKAKAVVKPKSAKAPKKAPVKKAPAKKSEKPK